MAEAGLPAVAEAVAAGWHLHQPAALPGLYVGVSVLAPELSLRPSLDGQAPAPVPAGTNILTYSA